MHSAHNTPIDVRICMYVYKCWHMQRHPPVHTHLHAPWHSLWEVCGVTWSHLMHLTRKGVAAVRVFELNKIPLCGTFVIALKDSPVCVCVCVCARVCVRAHEHMHMNGEKGHVTMVSLLQHIIYRVHKCACTTITHSHFTYVRTYARTYTATHQWYVRGSDSLLTLRRGCLYRPTSQSSK